MGITPNYLIFYLSNYFVAHICFNKDKQIKIFFLCCNMRNLQNNLNIIWQPPFQEKFPWFGLPHPFLANTFRPSPYFHQFWKGQGHVFTKWLEANTKLKNHIWRNLTYSNITSYEVIIENKRWIRNKKQKKHA